MCAQSSPARHPSAVDPSISFRVPPQPATARRVRDAVVTFARDHDVDEDRLADFLTALGEAIANAVEHSETTSPIDVLFRIGADRIVANIRDYGCGFDTTRLERELPEIGAERGRGVPIMRSCSDVFTIASVPGEGTAVVLERRLTTTGTFPAMPSAKMVAI